MTAKELAELFEVSERTIYRDVDKLTLAGIPVYTNQGKNGGISILPDYVLNKAVLTAEEKARLFDALNALNEVELRESSGITGKLRNFFGDRYQDWLEIEFSSWGNSRADADVFERIKSAIHACRLMEIVYSGSRGTWIKRTVKPLKLCFKDQAWYLYAWCCLRQDYRFFKLRRISEIAVLDTCFEPEPVGKVLSEVSKQAIRQHPPVKVTVEIHPDMAFRALDELADVSILEDHRLHCVLEVENMDWFISYVLSYGSGMRVLAPDFVKEKVVKAIEDMGRLYE